MSSYTAGPWEAQGPIVYKTGGFPIAYCEGNESDANAPLIAAAPEMLEAIKLLVEEGLDEAGSARLEDLVARILAKANGHGGTDPNQSAMFAPVAESS